MSDTSNGMGKTILPMAFSILFLAMITLAGCSSGSDAGAGGQDTPGVVDDGTYSGKASISRTSGGALTLETGDGTLVTLDIPAGALSATQDVTMTVTVSGEDSSSKDIQPARALTVVVEPALLLNESAGLTVRFPENVDGSDMVLGTGGSMFIPVKQGLETATLSGTVYCLGEFACLPDDDTDLVGAAYTLITQQAGDQWQDAYGTFDALVWLTTRLKQLGYSAESRECFQAVYEQGLASAQAFVSSLMDVEKGAEEHHALDKFRHLMALCENPENIISDLNALMPIEE